MNGWEAIQAIRRGHTVAHRTSHWQFRSREGKIQSTTDPRTEADWKDIGPFVLNTFLFSSTAEFVVVGTDPIKEAVKEIVDVSLAIHLDRPKKINGLTTALEQFAAAIIERGKK